MKLLATASLLCMSLWSISSFAIARKLDISGNKFGLKGVCIYHEEKQGNEVTKAVRCTDRIFPEVASYVNVQGYEQDPFYIGKTACDANGHVVYVFAHPPEVLSWGSGNQSTIID